MALYEEFEPRPNRLIDAQSAYLREAAYQPIGWYEFGPEAFAEAARQQKPLFVDIGAAWCHWCHVLDRESFFNPEIATLLNERYIPVKVDRDERPDIDARFQAAVQLLTGHGGWPLVVFLMPDGTPFYGGTYFPPDDRYGRIGMKTLLVRLADAFASRRAELAETARVLTARTEQSLARGEAAEAITRDTFARLTHGVRTRYNPNEGGFELGAPKFPQPGALDLALLQWQTTGDDGWRIIAEHTLVEMAGGGIYDQLAGGFHRYAVDAEWRVPHFEKMSYENALLAEVYTHAYRALKVPLFRDIADGTLDFLLTELGDTARGGFYAAQDADVGLEDDGGYFTWTWDELLRTLTPEEAEVLIPYFGVTREGNMPEMRRNVLAVATAPAELARQQEIAVEDVYTRIRAGKRRLLEARRRRTAPHVDVNKYTGWNGLCISACLTAGTLLGRGDAQRFVLRTLDMLLRDAYTPDEGFYHGLRDGARLPGFFDDQVYMARALLDAFAVTADPAHLQTARRLMELALDEYWDEEHGGFFDVARSRREAGESPLLRQPRKVAEDIPAPSPNALAAQTLDRLYALTHETRFREAARRTLEAFAVHAPEYGPFAAHYGMALFHHLYPPPSAIIVGPLDDARTQDLWHAALETYRPGRTVAAFPPDAAPYPAIEAPVAYVCAGDACAAPFIDPDNLRTQLREFGAPPESAGR
jgi:uncharacterized protein YyaL (SSP411 family)